MGPRNAENGGFICIAVPSLVSDASPLQPSNFDLKRQKTELKDRNKLCDMLSDIFIVLNRVNKLAESVSRKSTQ